MKSRWLPSPPAQGTVAELAAWLDENELRLAIAFDGRWQATLTSKSVRRAVSCDKETMLAALYGAIDRWTTLEGDR